LLSTEKKSQTNFVLEGMINGASSAAAKEKSPWASINDVLIQNKCWLCLNTFPKDRSKAVFQVSDLLTFYHNQHQRVIASSASVISADKTDREDGAKEEASGIGVKDFKFISENLQKCFDSYVSLMEAGDGKPDQLFEEFKHNDVEVWMSGLVCGGTPACQQESAYFIETKNKHATGGNSSGSSGDRKKVNDMFSFAIPDSTGCPPGCNCEPTWPFMP
jgi:hypothetical protein